MFKHILIALAFLFTAAPAMAAGPAPVKAKKAAKIKAVKNAKDATIDLNTATAAELITLPGVGPKKAAAIIAYRAKTPFTKVADATGVKGIGAKTVAKWDGKATVAAGEAKAVDKKAIKNVIKKKNGK